MDKVYLTACLAEGMSLKEIAKDAGGSPGTVGYWIRKHGLTANGSGKYDPNKALPEKRILEFVESRHSASQIARELGVSTQTIIRRLEKLGRETERTRRAVLIAKARAAGRTTMELECPEHGLTSFWVGKERFSATVAIRRR